MPPIPSPDPRPAQISSRLEQWFSAAQRPLPWRISYDPWHVWVSEIMLQQTRMEVVLERFPLFIQRFASPAHLAVASEEEVLAAWSGLGYYRRAGFLRRGAQTVVEQFGGAVPSDGATLRQIPGIGRYTAGAIASIAFDQREPIVDGNVARLMARLYRLEGATGSPALMREAWKRAAVLVQAAASPRVLNQAMMELGAMICRPSSPGCGECPVAALCESYDHEETALYPWPKERQVTRDLSIPLWIIRDAQRRLLMIRSEDALMSGMLHLPHGNDLLLPSVVLRSSTGGRLLGAVRHTITNRRITFEVRCLDEIGLVAEGGGEACWVHPSELGQHPHPSYVRKALSLLQN